MTEQNEPDVYCGQCEWEGLTTELVRFTHCPVCDSSMDIEDYNPEYSYDNEYFGGFNWNKK